MRLTDIPAVLIEDLVRTWRRRLIVGVIALAFGIAAISHGISAARLALEPLVGPLGARLVLVGVFVLIIAVAVLMLLRAERRDAAEKEAASGKALGGEDKVVAIAEAINLGYSLARDFRKGRAADSPASEPPTAPEEPAAEPRRRRPVDTAPA